MDIHELAFGASPDAPLVVDEKGSIFSVNARSERLFGFTRDELIGMRIE